MDILQLLGGGLSPSPQENVEKVQEKQAPVDMPQSVWGGLQISRPDFFKLMRGKGMDAGFGEGGGGGLGFSFGGGGLNDMERTILAHDEPGGFKVATDQYAAKYSDQLNEWALEELKHKIPGGPANGGTWEDEFARQAAARVNYENTGQLWGPEGLTGRTADTEQTIWNEPLPSNVSLPPLSGVADRDRDGLSSVVSASTNSPGHPANYNYTPPAAVTPAAVANDMDNFYKNQATKKLFA